MHECICLCLHIVLNRVSDKNTDYYLHVNFKSMYICCARIPFEANDLVEGQDLQ